MQAHPPLRRHRAVPRWTARNRGLGRLVLVFLGLGACYPLLRIELLELTGLPSAVLGAWVDLLSLTVLALLLKRGPSLGVMRNAVAIPVVLILAAGCSSILAADDLVAIGYGLRQTYLPMVFFFAGMRLGGAWPDTERLWKSLIAMAAGSALIGLVLSFLLTDYWTGLFLRDAANSRDWGLQAIARERGFRMTGAMLDPVVFGTISAWGAVFSLNALFVAKRGRQAALLTAALAVCLAATVLSLSRGAWLGAGLGALVAFLVNPSWLVSRKFAGFVLLIAVAVMSAGDGEQAGTTLTVLNTIEKTLSEGNVQREGQFDGVLDNLPARPFGHGLGRAGHVGERFSVDGMTPEGYPHITDGWYLKLLAEGGVLLFLAFGLFLLTLLLVLARRALATREPRQRAFLSALLGIHCATLVQAAVSNVWDLYFLSQLLWLLAGLAAGTPRPKRVRRRAAAPVPQHGSMASTS